MPMDEGEKRRIIFWVVGILAAALVLGLATCGGIFWVVWKATEEPVKVIRAQLDAINQNNYARAHSYFSASRREEQSLEEFQAFVEENAAMLKTRDSTFSSRKIENKVATIRGTLTSVEGRVTPVRYTLVKEGNRWVISSFRFAATEED